MDTKLKGNLTELQCITAFYELGYHVCIPYGENSRYDFIADVNGELLRIQVKTSKLLDDESAIEFSCRSSRINTQGSVNKKYTKDEIDYFCTYYDGKCYIVPVEECSTVKRLRLKEVKSSLVTGINWAKDYELSKMLNITE